MNKKLLFLPLIFLITLSYAQLKTVALVSSGSTTIFSDSQPIVSAYNAAQNGDTLYVSGGIFTFPASFNKSLSIFGVGHNPQFTTATEMTKVSNNFSLTANASDSHFEGIHFVGGISGANAPFSNVTFKRNFFAGTFSFIGDGNNVATNNLLIECILNNSITMNTTNWDNSIISNNIILSAISTSNNIVHNNIFTRGSSGYFNASNTSVFNNIFASTGNPFSGTVSGNIYRNNAFVSTAPSFGGDAIAENNYTGIDLNSFFIDFGTVGVFSYDNDYNLQNPADFPGQDGSQIGIYGGLFPFKDGSIPITPHIKSKNIASQTNASGELQIEIEVEAQNN